jgi:hypothetical protein
MRVEPVIVVPPAPAISVFTEMKPKDSVEAMIITQMISVHEMALLSSERALNNRATGGVCWKKHNQGKQIV